MTVRTPIIYCRGRCSGERSDIIGNGFEWQFGENNVI